ncbi:MAG: MFS transporter [Thermoflexaceae bacterium]|nr:MFS transporter [Lachnospiraceae bacterium]MDD6572690.1 MFS transporter [Thermoflexaceae bacterium]
MKENQQIPMWKKVCYGCGAGGGNVMSTLMASFLLAYYTDTALISAAAISTMFVICRLLDGVTDLVMGGIVDRTNTKLGKARPWLILSAPLMCIGLILIVSVPRGWSEAMKLVYAYFTYIFLNCIVYTIFGIAHSALLARMTRNDKERNTTSVVSSICNNAVGLVIGTAITGMQFKFGWTVTGIILGVTAGILILIPGITISEIVGMSEDGQMEKNESLPMKEQLPAVLKNKYFYLSLLIGAFTLLMNANAIGSQIFYCNVVLGEPMFMTQLMSIGQLPGIIVLFFMPWFSNKFSKRNFMLIGAGPMFAGVYALIADACDYGEWKTGIRSEGLLASSQSIGSKIGIGFGSALTGWILAFAGYNPKEMIQSETVINAIKFDFSWLGLIISVVLFICVLLMDVEKYMPQIHEALGKEEIRE